MAAPDATPTPAERFRDALVAFCREHGYFIRHYHIEYDEYDSDDGLEFVKLQHEYELGQLIGASEAKR